MFVGKIWFTNNGWKMVVAGRRPEIAYTLFTLVLRDLCRQCALYMHLITVIMQ